MRALSPVHRMLPLLLLAGCGQVLAVGTADVAGIAGAGAANAVTKSAAVATGIGLAIAAGADAGLQYTERRVHRYEQDRIAEAAGSLASGRGRPMERGAHRAHRG